MIPRARACNFSCCLAGGYTQEIITKEVVFHKHQTRISNRHDKDPTYIKWDLIIKNFVPSEKVPEGPWSRGDGTPQADFAEKVRKSNGTKNRPGIRRTGFISKRTLLKN